MLGLAASTMLGCGEPSSEGSDSESETESDSESDDGDGDGDADAEPVSVLLIGNSYTFVNDLPALLSALAAASPTPLVTDSLTMAGAGVVDHLANPELEAKLAEGFDVVIVQGQSVEPIVDYPTFEAAVVELAASAGDARVVLFETWPRQAGSPDLVELGLSVEQMYEGLASGYLAAALASGSEVGPVGGAWMSTLAIDPAIELYSDDGSHPAIAGSYLASCVLFGTIVEQSCSTSSFTPPELDSEVAEQLQDIADEQNSK